jgi:hypothetical protein
MDAIGNIIKKTTQEKTFFVRFEKAIYEAVEAVEEIGAHPLLTDAINLLAEASKKVAIIIK